MSTVTGSSGSGRLPREKRRANLLDAALEVFSAHGYHGAAMDEIAEAAGVSKPVLYQHFPGKRDLYLALLDRHLAELTGLLHNALVAEVSNEERLKLAVTAYFEFVAGDGQAHRLIFESDVANDPEVHDRIEEFQDKFAALIAQAIVEGTALSAAESSIVARALHSMTHACARYWLSAQDTIDFDAACALVCRLAWDGIARLPKVEDGA